MRAIEFRKLFKLSENSNAKSISKAKGVASPYFGMLSLVPAYA